MADQAKGKGIAPKRASNLADLGQSSRPLLPIRTLLEDKEDGKDYSKVIEVLKYLNTLKAFVKDSISVIKNISSTLASLTNSSNATATTTGKTSYSPRFDPFSSTIDLDSPLYPPRKEPYLGPAVNSATSNLDPPIDIGSKEGFKDTITSSMVKELSKKAYTIPDDKSKKEDVYNEFHALTFSTYRKGLLAFNAEFNSYLAKLTVAKIDIDPSLILNQNPATEAYRAAYIANSSYSTPNSISNPSKKGKNKKKGKKKASYNIKGQNHSAKSAEQASFILGSYNLAIEEEEESDSSSNSMEIPSNSIRREDFRPIIEDAIVSKAIEPNECYKLRNSPAKGTTLEGTREPKPLTSTRDLPFVLREPVIEGNEVEKAISSPTLKEPNIGQRDYYNLLNLAKLWHVRLGHIGLCLLKKTSSITKGLPNFDKIKEADFHCSSCNRGAFLNSALREEIYMEIPEGLLDLAASNKAIYKLLLKFSYNPSTPNIIKLSKALYGLKQSPREWQDKLKILLKSLGYLPLILDLGVFYNAKTCHFIVTYVDDCLFIGPNIGYITDLKKRLNKVYAIEDLGPAAYFLGLSRSLNRPTKSHLNAAKNLFKYLNSTKDYSICFSYNGNTVADLGPKLSSSSNTTIKLSRDFYSKEGPRPLTTTSTTIVDSRNGKGSSRTSIMKQSSRPTRK
ncbi:hypothetical protein P8C59_000096 [Phyllachora maydis]|uniref:Reverse transcriptase Ty1/copia-type domain-containing protein n=1 Tax=Phyllachora maydis TaxID=1825666 RepID=A0AAD9HWH1_9PEZI|nr:hypothetical protein P8C59_000096 [Phyllachora maydis]